MNLMKQASEDDGADSGVPRYNLINQTTRSAVPTHCLLTQTPAHIEGCGRMSTNVFGERNVPGVEAAEQRLAHACVHDQLLLHIRVALPREVGHSVRDEGSRVDPCLRSTYARARDRGTALVRTTDVRPETRCARRRLTNTHAWSRARHARAANVAKVLPCQSVPSILGSASSASSHR